MSATPCEPAAVAATARPTGGLSLLALPVGYPALSVKTSRFYRRVRGRPAADARLYAAACVPGRFPQVIGAAKYDAGRIGGRPSPIIESKEAEAADKEVASRSGFTGEVEPPVKALNPWPGAPASERS